jgi:hypothetical protein
MGLIVGVVAPLKGWQNILGLANPWALPRAVMMRPFGASMAQSDHSITQ